MNIDRKDLLETDVHKFCTEASDLGWRPGEWPEQFNVPGLGNGLPFLYHYRKVKDGDLQLVSYRQANGCVDITIFND